uniref:AMP-dependent synthetase/ligase domain-containing protein n=1 Tax=Ananas comosus var. bracteatus TaxID=296719 RepID=A0A6V7NPC1_ANACO|nr:unnamed protein product [Ananas comosus var. bracteatus]
MICGGINHISFILFLQSMKCYIVQSASKSMQALPEGSFSHLTLIKISLVYMEAKRVYEGGISGGGSLPMHIDRFFEVIGVNLQNSYGLTETSPVIAIRRPAYNILGTVGPPMKHTEIKVVDIENGDLLSNGSKGVIKIKGPLVMKGYYKNALATKVVMDEDGRFNTSDIGWIVPKHARGRSCECGGMLVIEGRAKDTILLSTGENVEPTVLEEAAMRSRLIHQIVVVGQDQRRLGALVVPNKDEILAVARKILLYDEIRTWTSECTFHIGPISIGDEPFTIENGLMTQTMKIRRDKVAARYCKQITNLYK